MNRLLGAALAAAAISAGAPALAQQDCRLQIAASLPVTIEPSGHVAVMGAIGDRPLKLLVDTGGFMMMRESIATELGIPFDVMKHWQRASVFGGIELHRDAVVKDFRLGNLRASGVTFFLFPDDEGKVYGAPDGILGANVLATYDVDFDYAHAKLNLFLPHRCPGQAVYWTQSEELIAKVPIEIVGAQIHLPVAIEGKPVKAILDTGATDTVMDLESLLPEFGLKPDSPGMQRVGTADDPHPRYLYTFKTLNFGGVTVNNARVLFVSEETSHEHGYNMLIGEDILRQLHLYIAYKEKMLYITAASAN